MHLPPSPLALILLVSISISIKYKQSVYFSPCNRFHLLSLQLKAILETVFSKRGRICLFIYFICTFIEHESTTNFIFSKEVQPSKLKNSKWRFCFFEFLYIFDAPCPLQILIFKTMIATKNIRTDLKST